jgi:hypothetical protein
MSGRPCSICSKPALAKFVDASPDLTAAALSRQAEQMGMELSADRILNHRKHRSAEAYLAPAKRKSDFAVLVREKAVEQFEAGELDLREKDHVAGINAGLKAQAIIDKRELLNKRNTQADALLALLGALRGDPYEAPLQLDDGLTIEGEAVEVETD